MKKINVTMASVTFSLILAAPFLLTGCESMDGFDGLMGGDVRQRTDANYGSTKTVKINQSQAVTTPVSQTKSKAAVASEPAVKPATTHSVPLSAPSVQSMSAPTVGQ